MLPVAPMPYTDLVNVQVGRTFGMAGWILPPTARSWSVSTPFHRTSPSVINRLIRAGSLLPSTRPCRVIRAMPSVSRAATPMKPRANLGNRTRQPKGRANKIASQPPPKKQMAQPYRRHRMGLAQETRMDAISRTIQKHTLYSGIHPPSKGPQPDSNRHLITHSQEEPENHARLTLPQER